MLEMNMKTSINNINYLRYMESKQQNNDNGGKSKDHLETERATTSREKKKQI